MPVLSPHSRSRHGQGAGLGVVPRANIRCGASCQPQGSRIGHKDRRPWGDDTEKEARKPLYFL
jgi:hypothetical protein